MSDVSCKAVAYLLKGLDENHISPDRLLAGLPLKLADLKDPHYRISWQLYHALCERYATLLETQPTPKTPLPMFIAHDWLTLMQEIAVQVVIIDRLERILYINGTNLFSQEEVVGKKVQNFLPVEYHERASTAIKYVIETGKRLTFETSAKNGRGEVSWFEHRLSPARLGDRIFGAVVVTEDITDRKKYEAAMQKRALQLQTVAEVSAQIKLMHDLPHLMQNICNLTALRFGLYHAQIFLLDEAGEVLVEQAASNYILRQGERTPTHLPIMGKGLIARAGREKQAIISNDTANDPFHLADPYLPNTRSEMALPIMAGETLIGVLDVQSDALNAFSREDQSVLQTLADQIAIAIQNAQLYQNIIQRWEVASILRDIGLALTSQRSLAEVLQITLKESQRVLPYDAAGIWLTDTDGRMRLVASSGYDRHGITHEQFEALFTEDSTPTLRELSLGKQAIIIPDTHKDPRWIVFPGCEWIRSFAGAPLVVRGEVVGRFTFDHGQPNFYEMRHEPILEALAQQISLAVENANLFESERQQRELADTLRDIGLVLASSLEQEDILQLVLAQVARVLPYDAAAVWLEKEDGLQAAALFGYEQFNAKERVKALIFSVPDGVLAMDEATIIADTYHDPRWTVLEGFEWVRSWACAPIVVRGRTIGRVALDHTQPNYYSEKKHKPILEALATQISIAVSNSLLFEAERRRRQEIEALQRGNVSLTSSLKLADVLDAILGATFDLLPIRDAYIYLYEDGKLTFGAGVENHIYRRRSQTTPPRENGVTYTVARSGEMMVIPDLRAHPLFQPPLSPWLEELQGMISVPLKIGERVVGVMNITFETAAALRKVEKGALQFLAQQASIAIENARLYKAVQDHAALLESRVEERTAELSRERAQLHAILEDMGEGVIYDEEFEVKYINQTLSELTGFRLHDEKDFVALMRRLLAPQTDLNKLVKDVYGAIAKVGHFRREVRLCRADGSEFDASMTSRAVHGEDRAIQGAVTLIRDISQEKALQEQKDRFISNASHELRTPITNIQTRLYLLQKRPDRLQEHLKVIETVTDQMSSLVEDLLDISRFERGVITMHREKVLLQDLIRQVVHTQQPEAERRHLHLGMMLPPTPLEVLIDPRRMTQVLTNLVTNAISYTEEGGEVQVQLLTENDQYVVIHVKDTGIGIPAHLLPQVFQPFFRAKEGMVRGTGLGLSISKEIVEAHHGTLTVSSEEGVGSTFTVTLPVYEV